MDLVLEKVILSYTEHGGDFDKIPKRGNLIIFEDTEYIVLKAYPICVYTDGGKSPFTVKIEAFRK
jgi:hypothetical protein